MWRDSGDHNIYIEFNAKCQQQWQYVHMKETAAWDMTYSFQIEFDRLESICLIEKENN